jgi:hypothetical protein
MKHSLKIICIVIIVFVFYINAFADTNILQVQKIFDRNSIINDSEKDALNKVFSDSLDRFANLINNNGFENNVKMDKNNTLNNFKKAIKLYMVDSSDIVKEYNENSSFKKMISSEYIWLFPVFDSNNKVISIGQFEKSKKYEDMGEEGVSISVADKEEVIKRIKENEGKWNWTSLNNSIPNEGVEFIIDENKISELLQNNGITNPAEIKVVPLPGFYTNMLYIEADGKEYGIPFSLRDDFSNLKSGVLYEMKDLINAIGRSQIYTNKISANDTFGSITGGGINTSQVNNTKVSYIIVFCILLLTVFMFIILYNRHNKKVVIKN